MDQDENAVFARLRELQMGFRERADENTQSKRAPAYDALIAAGVNAATVSFDGNGDEGSISGLCLDPRGITLDDRAHELVIDYAEALLEKWCPGWEVNEGSSGTITFDTETQEAEITLTRRYLATADLSLDAPVELLRIATSAGISEFGATFDGEETYVYGERGVDIDAPLQNHLLELCDALARSHGDFALAEAWNLRVDVNAKEAELTLELGEREDTPTTFVD